MVDKVEKIWMDGELVPWDDAKVHVLTHSLHYGLGAFEGIRAYHRADRNHDRLSAGRAHRPAPRNLQAVPHQAAARPRGAHPGMRRPLRKTRWRRLTFARWSTSARGPWASTFRRTRSALSSWPGAGAPTSVTRRSRTAFARRSRRGHATTSAVSLAKAKTMGQYTNSVLAKAEAKLGGYDEAILLDTQGYVARVRARISSSSRRGAS